MNHSTIPFNNSYARLPERMFSHQLPEQATAPELIQANRALAESLGIDADWLGSSDGIATIAGNLIPDGAEPIATAYAGHQFGSWNPQLGDGRAVLLGEVLDKQGQRYDLQLKGSGRTPYSRGGDGRAPLGPVLREYILSEAMAVLGVPTTRALAAVTTGDSVYREERLPGAVLARVAQSHIRVGTFQYFASRNDLDALQDLSQHVINRHFPLAAKAENPILALLQSVITAQATLIARWQLIGFIHGVMNTDNMLLCGETVDYGPCAFMDEFNADSVFSSIDQAGRYSYRSQPAIAHWNLACFAQTLIPLLHADEEQAVAMAQQAVDAYAGQFLAAHERGMGEKLGLQLDGEEDEALVQELLRLMTETSSDFTLVFRRLADLACPDSDQAPVSDLFEFTPAWDSWLEQWLARSLRDPRPAIERQNLMYRVSPVFIPRNHLVEAAIIAATRENDFSVFQQLLDVLSDPFSYRPAQAAYATPPRPEQVVRQTFCGT